MEPFTLFFLTVALSSGNNNNNNNNPTVVHVNDGKESEVVIYEAHTECELRAEGTILECFSLEKNTGRISYSVCTIDEHGTQCIDADF